MNNMKPWWQTWKIINRSGFLKEKKKEERKRDQKEDGLDKRENRWERIILERDWVEQKSIRNPSIVGVIY